MNDWYSRPDLNTLDDVIEHLAMPRWAFRDPRIDEEEPDEDGRVLIATRDECLRSVCLKWVYQAGTGYAWMLWAEERRDTPQSEWAVTDWFPRLFIIKENLPPYGAGTRRNRWRIADMCITERSNEWKWLAPAELHALLDAARRGVAAPIDDE